MHRIAVLLLSMATLAASQEDAAATLLTNVLEHDGGDWALSCPRISLGGYTIDSFLDALTETWVEKQGRRNASVPEKLLNWGTSGKESQPWKFVNPALNRYFKKAFANIKLCMWQNGHSVNFTRFDLFHGHAFTWTHDGVQDFGILYHAMEYPTDLPTGVTGAPFTSDHPSFYLRNILWVASKSQAFLIDTNNNATEPLYIPDWLVLGVEDWMDEYYHDVKRARTVSDRSLSSLGQHLGGVNFFICHTVSDLVGPEGCGGRDMLYFL